MPTDRARRDPGWHRCLKSSNEFVRVTWRDIDGIGPVLDPDEVGPETECHAAIHRVPMHGRDVAQRYPHSQRSASGVENDIPDDIPRAEQDPEPETQHESA